MLQPDIHPVAGPALSQKAAAAASRPSSRASAVYTLMGGQDLAPHTSAQWMRGSSGVTTWRAHLEVDESDNKALHALAPPMILF